MKKLFTLIALTLLCVGGVKADVRTVLLEYQMKATETAAKTEYTAGDGKVYFGAAKVAALSGTDCGYGFSSDGDTGSSKYVKITLPEALTEDDEIEIKCYSTKTDGGISLYDAENSSSSIYDLTLSAKNSEQALTYTLPSSSGLIGKKEVFLFRYNKVTTSITEIKVTKVVKGATVTMNFSASTANAEVGDSFTPPSLSIDPSSLSSSVTYSSSTPSVASVNETTGEITLINAGTTTITASYAGDATYAPASASYELTVTSTGPTVLVAVTDEMWNFSTWTKEAYAAGTEIINNLEIIKETVTNIAVDGNNKSIDGYSFTQRLKLGGGGSTTDRTLHFKVAGNSKITVYGMSGSSNTERTAIIAAGAFGSQIGELTNDGNAIGKAEVIYVGGETDIYIYSTSGGFNIYGIKVESNPTVSVTVGTTGFATLTPSVALDFSATAIQAYKASVSGDKISFTKVEQVAAGEGVLLYAEGGKTEDIPVGNKSAADADNAFVGTLTDIAALASTDGGNTNYILNNGSEGIGFYKANGKKVAAGKAYLQAPSAATAKSFFSLEGFDIDGVVTGINEVKAANSDNVLYNLNGVRVGSAAQKGVYILNGKKYVVK